MPIGSVSYNRQRVSNTVFVAGLKAAGTMKLAVFEPLVTTCATVFSAGLSSKLLSFQSNQQARKSLPSPPVTVTPSETLAPAVQLPPPRTTPSSEALSASAAKL